MAVSINVHYTDRTSDPTKQPFTLVPGEVNSSETSLVLSGQGAPDYSTHVNENFLHLLENFASVTPPLHGTVGQLWFNVDSKELRMLTNIGVGGGGERVDTWSPVGTSVTTGATPPALTNRLWYDTSDALTSNHQLKIYNSISSQWQPVTKQWVVVGNTAPTNRTILWYNTAPTHHELYVYDTTADAWQPVVSHDAGLLTGSVPNAVLTSSSIGGNAATATLAAAATKLATGRTITLSGGATATGTFDGTANLTLNVTALNANVLSTGTVPIARIGSSGTRAVGFYFAGDDTWTALPYIPDSYTKTESNAQLATKANQDGITFVGFASNDPNLPYMRRTSDNTVYYLQRRLGYTPAPQANTLAGYGITDAYTKAQVNSLIPTVPSYSASIGGTEGFFQLPNGVFAVYGRFSCGSPRGANQNVWFTRSLGAVISVHITPDNAATEQIGASNISGVGMTIQKGIGDGSARTGFWMVFGV